MKMFNLNSHFILADMFFKNLPTCDKGKQNYCDKGARSKHMGKKKTETSQKYSAVKDFNRVKIDIKIFSQNKFFGNNSCKKRIEQL